MEDAQTATPIQAPTRKRTRAASPIQPPIQPTFQFQASPPIEFPQYSTIQQCIYAAQGLIQKAAQLARPSPAENSRLLDLLEVFREYTQKGRLPATSSIIHAQVQSLEKATRAIDNKIKAIKPTQRQPERGPQPPSQQSKPASYAAIAATSTAPTTAPSNPWITPQKKNRTRATR